MVREEVAIVKYSLALRKAKKDRDTAMAGMRRAIRAADDAGVPRSEIVRLSGLARQTVYDALAGTDEPVPPT